MPSGESNLRPLGMPGIVGRSIAISKKANKRKEKLERKQREAEDRDGKHVDQFGQKVEYKSLLRKRTRKDDEDEQAMAPADKDEARMKAVSKAEK